MKQLLYIFLFALSYSIAGAQTLTPQYLGGNNTVVINRGLFRADSAQGLPKDTIMRPHWPKTLPHIAEKNGKLYLWSTSEQRWKESGGGTLDSIIVATKYWVGQNYIDTAYRRNDSLFYKKNGTELSLGTYLTKSTADLVYASLSGNNNYIQNQQVSQQNSNYWVKRGRATKLTADSSVIHTPLTTIGTLANGEVAYDNTNNQYVGGRGGANKNFLMSGDAAPLSGGTGYIQNQFAVAQPSASAWISGDFTSDGNGKFGITSPVTNGVKVVKVNATAANSALPAIDISTSSGSHSGGTTGFTGLNIASSWQNSGPFTGASVGISGYVASATVTGYKASATLGSGTNGRYRGIDLSFTSTMTGAIENSYGIIGTFSANLKPVYGSHITVTRTGTSESADHVYGYYADVKIPTETLGTGIAYSFYGANGVLYNAGSAIFGGKITIGDALNLPASTAPSSSADAAGAPGDIIRDASGVIYLKTSTGWLKFTGVTF